MGLFLFTSILGRVWCGYACPQTVWVDLYQHVERWIDGDRNAQFRLLRQKWNLEKIRRRFSKWLIWLLIAIATGGAWIFYFADAPSLFLAMVSGTAPSVAYATVGVLTATTFVLGGFMREQVCIYMCPWPRIQGAMLDENSLIVSYKDWRGEPRGRHRKQAGSELLGDCIDCDACVAVCPTGVDIRQGQQIGCITCALCIDACDDIMARIGKPRGLIDYCTLADQPLERAGTFPGLVVKNSYVASQGWDRRTAAQRALGWTAAADYGNGVLRVAMTGRDGMPVRGLRVVAVVGRLGELGYPARPYDAAAMAEIDRDSAGRDLLVRLAVAGFAAMNVMLLSVSVWAGAEAATRDLLHWISALIALPAIAFSGMPFFRSALGALAARRLNMDVPISLAVCMAAGTSLVETIHGGEQAYFDAAISLIFFLLIGRYLDHRSRASARSAAAELTAMSARAATVSGRAAGARRWRSRIWRRARWSRWRRASGCRPTAASRPGAAISTARWSPARTIPSRSGRDGRSMPGC